MSKIKEWTKKVKEIQTLLITIMTSIGAIIGAGFILYNTYFKSDIEIIQDTNIEVVDSTITPTIEPTVKEVIIYRETPKVKKEHKRGSRSKRKK